MSDSSETTICVKKGNCFINIDTNEITERNVKNDWMCHLCRSYPCDFNIFNKDNFKLACKSCSRMDFISFIFDNETKERLIKYMDKK